MNTGILKKYKFKLFIKKNSKYLIGISLLLVGGLVGIYFSYSRFFVKQETEVVRTTVGEFISGDVIIGAYIGGEYSKTLPAKDSGYVVTNIVCDKDANPSWNNDTWSITLSNVKEKNKCNVYFQKEDNSSLDKIISKLDTSGKCPSVNSDGTVNVTAGESENSLVCSAPDDYGTSYYFRGNVTDNYVKYSDRYWRIIRINGDGTIRMIYDGTEAHANGEVSDDRRYTESYFDIIYDVREANYMYGSQVGIVKSNIFCSSCYGEKMSISRSFSMQKNKYNLYELVLDNPVSVSCADMENNLDKYLGYYFEFGNGGLGHVISTEKSCYGEELFIGPISKEDAQQNVLSSHFKIDTDSLFTNNIIAPSFRGIIKDEIYCNDRNTNSSNYVQDSVYFRWADTPWSSSSKQYPRLKCSQINDAFTVNDTNKGNGALTYPVGNLTADEAVLAGAWSNENTKYFLYDGKGFATMSPHQVFSPIISAIGSIMKIESNGSLASADDVYPFGIRPVINVSSVILNNGSGTSTDPYRLEN